MLYYRAGTTISAVDCKAESVKNYRDASQEVDGITGIGEVTG
jgi:hypothetical protein